MTLMERIADAEKCSVTWCQEPRVEGAEFCGSAGNGHLTDWYRGRIRRLGDGTFVGCVGPQPRWRQNLQARDLTGEIAA